MDLQSKFVILSALVSALVVVIFILTNRLTVAKRIARSHEVEGLRTKKRILLFQKALDNMVKRRDLLRDALTGAHREKARVKADVDFLVERNSCLKKERNAALADTRLDQQFLTRMHERIVELREKVSTREKEYDQCRSESLHWLTRGNKLEHELDFMRAHCAKLKYQLNPGEFKAYVPAVGSFADFDTDYVAVHEGYTYSVTKFGDWLPCKTTAAQAAEWFVTGQWKEIDLCLDLKPKAKSSRKRRSASK